MRLLNLNLQVNFFSSVLKAILNTCDIQYSERKKKSKSMIQQEGNQDCTGFSLKYKYKNKC